MFNKSIKSITIHLRSSIHAHGAVRFKNDPGLTQLATKAYIGRLAAKKLSDSHDKHDLATDIIDQLVKIK